MWSEKYRPQKISDMVGNEETRSVIMEWFAKWKKGTKPLLLVGPPGIGKTTIAFLVAKQFGYDMIGLNASDVRSKSRINEILTPVLGNVSVLGTPMIFVDEVDGIHGRGDYGGVAALVDILKEPTVPIILAANDDSADKMKNIKKAVKIISFKKIPPRLLRVYLENILKKENANLSPGSLIKVIDKSRGDIRSMINLTQSFVTGFNPQTETTFENIDVEEGVNAFFKAKSLEEARIVLYSMQIDPREKINAFYSSIITSNLDNNALAKYLEVISEADMLYGKIIKTQNWRLLRYLNDVLIKLYENDDRIRYAQYNLSWPLLNRIRWDGAKIKSLSSVMAKKLHLSSSAFVTIGLPFVLFCIKNKTLELELEETFGDIIDKEIELMQ
ncbi:ATPase central domain-containing protein [Candidatus Nitrosopumilus koreensis AR1]|uniref:ATPase central domain-containing protein n=1 Tax=Candidatus Nitrosopumilus koreensis AR1 TaxID=1229908 RepID=K0B3V1_9ARCH|nr:AAA family ATPase [Candidatus Nitrosopumilus koreensis]AFS80149.1 ATPase central domain-containing protein [Candidatus Nitrosopumilus koreensis AR1]